MGFYGRVFAAASKSCVEPSCRFLPGGEPSECSKEAEILLDSGIGVMVKKHNIKPVLYKKEAVKVATWGDQWAAYDEAYVVKNIPNEQCRWTDCQRFKNIGYEPPDAPDGFCQSGCPSNRLRVALDTISTNYGMVDIGGKAHCCKMTYGDEMEAVV